MNSSVPEQAIFYYISQMFNAVNNYADESIFGKKKFHFDIFLPDCNAAIEYDGARWHKIEKVATNDWTKNILCLKSNTHYVRLRESGLPEMPLCSTIQVDVKGKYDNYNFLEKPIKDLLEELYSKYKKFAIRTPSEIDVNISRDLTAFIGALAAKDSDKSLAKLFPDAWKQWDYEGNGELTPENIHAYSKVPIRWVCPCCKKKWVQPLNERTKHNTTLNGVRQLSNTCENRCNANGIPRERNILLLEKYPELSKHWDYQKNKNVDVNTLTIGNTKKYWWINDAGESIQNTPPDLIRKYKRNNNSLPRTKTLITQYEKILKYFISEGDTKNIQLETPQSRNKNFWLIDGKVKFLTTQNATKTYDRHTKNEESDKPFGEYKKISQTSIDGLKTYKELSLIEENESSDSSYCKPSGKMLKLNKEHYKTSLGQTIADIVNNEETAELLNFIEEYKNRTYSSQNMWGKMLLALTSISKGLTGREASYILTGETQTAACQIYEILKKRMISPEFLDRITTKDDETLAELDDKLRIIRRFHPDNTIEENESVLSNVMKEAISAEESTNHDENVEL